MYKNKYTLVGDGRSLRTSKQQLEKERLELGDDKVFTKGFLYTSHRNQKFLPALCYNLESFFFAEPTPMGKLLNDCVVHCINYALRYAYFVSREQIGRLVMLNQK